jgi:hypothetical protein
VQGPYFNDESGDTFSIIYAFTSEGFSYRELKDYVESVRARLLRVPDVNKVDLLGVQDEKIYIEFSTREVVSLGLIPGDVIRSLQAQNNVAPAGLVSTDKERILIFVSGAFGNEERNRLYREMAKVIEAYAPWRLDLSRYRNMLVQPWVQGFKKHPILRAEWQYALALSTPVIPVLRIGKMASLPREVDQGHCIDACATRPTQDAFDAAIHGFTKALARRSRSCSQ